MVILDSKPDSLTVDEIKSLLTLIPYSQKEEEKKYTPPLETEFAPSHRQKGSPIRSSVWGFYMNHDGGYIGG